MRASLPKAGKDRRREPRLPESRVVRLYGGPGGGEERGSAYLHSLSARGAGLESAAVLREGERVEFDLLVPVRVSGRVSRVRTRGAGFEYGVALETRRLGWIDRWLLRLRLRRARRERGAP